MVQLSWCCAVPALVAVVGSLSGCGGGSATTAAPSPATTSPPGTGSTAPHGIGTTAAPATSSSAAAAATSTAAFGTTEAWPASPNDQCLCVFDIDRTLTGTHRPDDGSHMGPAECPANQIHEGVPDFSFGSGTLYSSELAQQLRNTFCVRCYHGLVSSGVMTSKSDHEKAVILGQLGGPAFVGGTTTYSDGQAGDQVSSALVLHAENGAKEKAVRKIVDWYATQGVAIKDSQVFFFDDVATNVSPFASTGFNARQVSCASRIQESHGPSGLCGGMASEAVDTPGVQVCDEQGSAVIL